MKVAAGPGSGAAIGATIINATPPTSWDMRAAGDRGMGGMCLAVYYDCKTAGRRGSQAWEIRL